MKEAAEPRHPEYQYLDILQEILDHGDKRMDRTGVGTLALFGRHMRFDVSNAFPVLTTRKNLLADRREGDAVDALGRDQHPRAPGAGRALLDGLAVGQVPP